MKLQALDNMTAAFGPSNKMPVIFAGHGSPMNAIEDNTFSRTWQQLSQQIGKPSAVLCISAHWETRGTHVTAMEHPPTIHDFGGFPEALYAVDYPAPGSPELAKATQALITSTDVTLDQKWGLDHGAWSVIRHFYPKADVPVIQMSLDHYQSPQYHYDLARQLSALRQRGVLIIGSGNVVHNLRALDWPNEQNGYDWSIEANEKIKTLISKDDHKNLIAFRSQGKAFDLAIPTPEHYLPLLYTLGLKDDKESVSLFNDQLVMGSISMTSLLIH